MWDRENSEDRREAFRSVGALEVEGRCVPEPLQARLDQHVGDWLAVQTKQYHAIRAHIADLGLNRPQSEIKQEMREAAQVGAEQEWLALRVVSFLLNTTLFPHELVGTSLGQYVAAHVSPWVGTCNALNVVKRLAGVNQLDALEAEFFKVQRLLGPTSTPYDYALGNTTEWLSISNRNLSAYAQLVVARGTQLRAEMAILAPAQDAPELFGLAQERIAIRRQIAPMLAIR